MIPNHPNPAFPDRRSRGLDLQFRQHQVSSVVSSGSQAPYQYKQRSIEQRLGICRQGHPVSRITAFVIVEYHTRILQEVCICFRIIYSRDVLNRIVKHSMLNTTRFRKPRREFDLFQCQLRTKLTNAGLVSSSDKQEGIHWKEDSSVFLIGLGQPLAAGRC